MLQPAIERVKVSLYCGEILVTKRCQEKVHHCAFVGQLQLINISQRLLGRGSIGFGYSYAGKSDAKFYLHNGLHKTQF